MAIIEVVIGVADLSGLMLRLFPRGDDTPANGSGDSLTEQTNRKGCYRAAIAEPLVGIHEAYVFDAEDNLLFTGAVEMNAAPAVYTVGELGDVPVSTRASGTAVASILVALEGLVATVVSAAAAIAAIPAAVWGYAVRVLTTSTASGSSVEQNENELTLHRGDTLTVSLTGRGDLRGRQKLWFTLKSKRSDPDSAAQLLAEETEGLLVLASGEAADGETATITVEDDELGAVSIVISAAASKKLQPTTTGVWDLQLRDGSLRPPLPPGYSMPTPRPTSWDRSA